MKLNSKLTNFIVPNDTEPVIENVPFSLMEQIYRGERSALYALRMSIDEEFKKNASNWT